MGGKKAAPSTNVNQAPWIDQQGYLKEVFHNAQNNYIHHVNDMPYAEQTYASFSPQTENALNLTEARALAGSPAQKAGVSQLEQTLRGDFLHGGPGFDAAFKAASDKIIPDIESRFNKGGRFGSGLAREAEAKALADVFAGQYQNERQNQIRSMFAAPQIAQQDYNDLAALAGVGQQREGQVQSKIDEEMWRHLAKQDMPWDILNKYAQMISGNYGSTTNQSGFKGNRGAGVLGGALSGASVGGTFGGPAGAGIGGILGGIGGLF